MKQLSKQKKLAQAIAELEVGQYLDAYDFIITHWKKYDYFIRRSFDVYLSQAKKQLPDRVFKTEKGLIKRIS